jgi:hypothetical protein
LTEEVIGAASMRSDPARSNSTRGDRAMTQSSNYANDVYARQPRLVDLIPRRYSTVAVGMVVGLAMVAALEALYAWMPQLSKLAGDGRLAALDLDGEGSLGVWFSSTTLALASLISLVVYSVRKHRQDDYNARYRVWLWAAAAWLMMSVDEGASLHEGFKDVMCTVTGQHLLGDGSLWWVSSYLIVLGTLGMRLVVEMRACRAAVGALLATGLTFALAVLAQVQWFVPETGVQAVMIEEGCEMVGNLLLVLSLTLYARHVILDASGLLAAVAAKEASKAKKKAEARTDIPSVAATPATAGTKTAAPARPAVHADEEEDFDEEYEDRSQRKTRAKHRVDDAEDFDDDRKLNKADRKAMRRQKEQQRRGDLK